MLPYVLSLGVWLSRSQLNATQNWDQNIPGKYDYQHAKCEDSKLIKAWFAQVQETIEKYGIISKDIYNMDETGFQIGVASTAKVICGSETKQSHAKSL